jgi:hypothetical protein
MAGEGQHGRSMHEDANEVLACPQLNSSATDEEVEEALDFQLEELTVMAKKELELVDRMAEWRPWEAPEVGGGCLSVFLSTLQAGTWPVSSQQAAHQRRHPVVKACYIAQGHQPELITEEDVAERLEAAGK